MPLSHLAEPYKYPLLAVLLLVVTTLAYSPALSGPLFFDDEHFILKNEAVHNLDIKRIYTSSVTSSAGVDGNFYRPTPQLIFGLLYQIWGTESGTPYHLATFSFHLAAGVLLLLLLRQLGFSNIAALLGAAIWLLHPVQTEAVAYASALGDTLSAAAVLAAWLCFTLATTNYKSRATLWYSLSIAAFLVGLFTKENAVVFFGLLIATQFFLYLTDKTSRKLPQLKPLAIYSLVTAGYLVLRFTVFNFGASFALTEATNEYTSSLLVRLITFISILWEYAKLIVYPANLFYEKPYVAYATLLSWRAAFGLALLAAVIYALVTARRHPRLSFSFAIFFIALAPFTGIFPLNAMFLEHWLYLPLVALAIAVAALWDKLGSYDARRGSLLGLLIILMLYGFQTHFRANQWGDIEKFYLNEINIGSPTVRVVNNLGMYYSDQGKMDRAAALYRQAAGGKTGKPEPHHNLGHTLIQQGQVSEAISSYLQALCISPNFAPTLEHLSQILPQLNTPADQARLQQAIQDAQSGQLCQANRMKE